MPGVQTIDIGSKRSEEVEGENTEERIRARFAMRKNSKQRRKLWDS
jgi:hypothetical protein